jgi:DUF1365 family protein
VSPASCIYEGHVRHRRYTPVENHFHYRVFMMYLDLAELPTLFQGRWLWSADTVNLAYFRRRDHLGDPHLPLDQAVRDLVEVKTKARPTGPIRLLTHLRYFGYCFNPVSFYFCYDPLAQHVEAIVAEVHNTPWGDEHCYVLPEADNLSTTSGFKRFEEPGESLNVHFMDYFQGTKIFDATLTLKRREITPYTLARVLLAYPPMTLKVITLIHWQALRLWLKGATFYVHPKK